MTYEEFKELKPGDHVLLKTAEECEDSLCGAYVASMEKFTGQIVTIDRIVYNENFTIKEDNEGPRRQGNQWYWHFDHIEEAILSTKPEELSISTSSLF